jgi:ABC-type Fe3+/spermidine/putrescine transport system ATPase subunit
MRSELVRLQKEVGITFVMVTHDQSEALAVANRVAILNAGRLAQIGTAKQIYATPQDAFVADFIGRVNLFDIRAIDLSGDSARIEVSGLGLFEIPLGELPEEKPLCLAVRPEVVRLSQTEPRDQKIRFAGEVADLAFQGDFSLARITLSDGVSLDVATREPLLLGAKLWCCWQAEDCHILPRGSYQAST